MKKLTAPKFDILNAMRRAVGFEEKKRQTSVIVDCDSFETACFVMNEVRLWPGVNSCVMQSNDRCSKCDEFGFGKIGNSGLCAKCAKENE